jgi:hypothetical protein
MTKPRMGQQNQVLQRGVFGQHAEPVVDLFFCLALRLNWRRLRVISHGF